MAAMVMSYLRSIPIRVISGILLLFLRMLVRWRPMAGSKSGYTILLGCNSRLEKMLLANLAMVSRQDLRNLHQIIIVFDHTRGRMGDVESGAIKAFPSLPLKFIYYTSAQMHIARAIRSPWVFAWLSWSLGIRETSTRYAFLHDFDAFLIKKSFLEERYAAIRESGAAYLGMQRYAWGQIPAELGYVQTFEMVFDVAFVRERFEPLDLFNRVHTIKGKAVVMDTFLHAQSLAGERVLIEASETDLVHPGQMICQFQNLMFKRSYVPPGKNNLLLIPYFLFLGQSPETLSETTITLENATRPVLSFFGRRMDLSCLDKAHVEKITRQAQLLEIAMHGEVREPVKRYFAALAAFHDRANPVMAAQVSSSRA